MQSLAYNPAVNAPEMQPEPAAAARFFRPDCPPVQDGVAQAKAAGSAVQNAARTALEQASYFTNKSLLLDEPVRKGRFGIFGL
jgi:hypothetical protein